MDTSETYVRLCEKATEIQNTHEWSDGDYTQYGIYIEHYWNEFSWKIDRTENPYIYLPRQDQLQAMADEANLFLLALCFYFFTSPGATVGVDSSREDVGKAWGDDTRYVHQFTSMEQLWLAAVMDWKFNKRWDGSNWIARAST